MKFPMDKMSSVSPRVRKTANTAVFSWVLMNSMYVLKMNNASKIHARSWLSAATVRIQRGRRLVAAIVGCTTSWTHRPRPIQKAP